MKPWLTVVIPTAGKRHAGLLRTVDSIRYQDSGDQVEVLVVADTHGRPDRAELDTIRVDLVEDPRQCRWVEFDGGINCYGQPQRTHGSRLARADWVAYSQDDNILSQDALDAISLAVQAQVRKRPLFFRALTFWGETVWRDRDLAQGNIDADCLVLPRTIAQHVEWGLRYEGDFDAAVQAARSVDGDVGWCERTIAIARPAVTWW